MSAYQSDCPYCKSRAINNGYTPLIVVAQEGIVQYLLQQRADKNKATSNGATPVLFAARNGHLAVVQQGVDKNKAAINGATPSAAATTMGHTAAAKLPPSARGRTHARTHAACWH
jgi:ankyrin repeat protein